MSTTPLSSDDIAKRLSHMTQDAKPIEEWRMMRIRDDADRNERVVASDVRDLLATIDHQSADLEHERKRVEEYVKGMEERDAIITGMSAQLTTARKAIIDISIYVSGSDDCAEECRPIIRKALAAIDGASEEGEG